jgi:hypothetical protein
MVQKHMRAMSQTTVPPRLLQRQVKLETKKATK